MAERSPLSMNAADGSLLHRLGGLLEQAEPVPADVVLAARSAFAWRDLDAQLALLKADEGMLVRGHGDQRLLTFEAPDLTIVVEVTEIGEGRRLVGQLVPAGPAEVSLEAARSPDGELSAPVDSLGRFALPEIPSGHIRFRCVLSNGQKVVTQWLDN
ncbi:MAG TPA: hypothetical protein VGX23_06525 [Actinocrinis sp.]|nr:hypothetical protein [Actinocrinis sp.]